MCVISLPNRSTYQSVLEYTLQDICLWCLVLPVLWPVFVWEKTSWTCFHNFSVITEQSILQSPRSPQRRKFFESLLAGTLREIFFIFELWPPLQLSGEHLQCTLGVILIRHNGAIQLYMKVTVNILTPFLPSLFSWAAQLTTVCLDFQKKGSL